MVLGRWVVASVLWTIAFGLMLAQVIAGPPMMMAPLSVLFAILAACVTLWGVVVYERVRTETIVAIAMRAVMDEARVKRIKPE